ncbi:DUF4133 domain-containing protein [Pedobacter sp. Leaf250]|uniref:DUF4133 domain-containing protein n=1 Tax=Pedobacter sp. Leaf250 TaxID=2876559 RepID=UPI001E2B6DAE|nr:DUF4133 domain-containing protein [Pedobacter sp. Leaf250]
MERYPIYKGLAQPLSYKGLKGKYIGWGIASLASGLFFGGLIGAFSSMYLGILISFFLSGGLFSYTLYRQKGGLHNKSKAIGLFIHQNRLKL